MKRTTMAMAVVAAVVVPGVASNAVKADSEFAIEEVVVSAQRREQSLQDVPISITAFNEEAIEKFRITNLKDLGLIVPNLSAVEGSGGTRSVLWQIRGLYASGTALGADSGVATYIDGVYLKGGSAGIVNYADVERVEVLRGPQGTLFGRNTSGGAINFITRNPSGEFEFTQKLTTGNYGQFESKTSVDLPKMGPVSARFSYSSSERDGYTKNNGAGYTYDLTPYGGGKIKSPKELGGEESTAMFLAASFDLHDDLSLVYKYDYNEVDAVPPPVGILGTSPVLAGLVGGIGFGESLGIPASSAGVTLPDSVANGLHLPSYSEHEGHNLTAEFALSDTVTIRNILSYREGMSEVPGQTLDGFGFSPAFQSQILGNASPYSAVMVFFVTGGTDKEETSEEFQVIVDNENYTLTTGALYYQLDQVAGGYRNAPNAVYGGTATSLWALPGGISTKSSVDVESTAVYSQLEYRLNSEWDVIVGGRFTNDKKDYIDNTLIAVPGYDTIRVNYDEDEFTYLIGSNYKPTDDIMLFAKYSTGYISGGIVSSFEYDAEKSKSFEVGMKASWLDNRLQTNIAVFDVKYENQQFGTAGNLVDPPVPASQVLVNAGETEASGMELEAIWLPVISTRVGLNLGYLDFDFVDLDIPLLGGPINEHLRPQWTGTLTLDYETDPLIGDAPLSFHMDASYRSAEQVVTRPVDYIVGDGRNPDTWRFNAHVALQDLQVGPGELTVALWGRNLTDSDLPNNMNTLGPVVAGQYEMPRTYGLDLTYRF